MMLSNQLNRGGATIGILNTLDEWESGLILNLRLWCDGPQGKAQVSRDYRDALPVALAENELQAFETLVSSIITLAQRPLVRHDVSCACVGADEGVFLHLLRTASEGHLNDAALIATLLVGPGHAERIALLAGQVGACSRDIHKGDTFHFEDVPNNVVRLH